MQFYRVIMVLIISTATTHAEGVCSGHKVASCNRLKLGLHYYLANSVHLYQELYIIEVKGWTPF